MLSQDELTEALHEGLKGSGHCSDTYCRAGATIENEGYTVFHNSIGPSTTDVQHVHNTGMLGKSKEQLAERIKTWVAGLHTGVRLDLNAAMSVSEMFGLAAEAARAYGEALAAVAECERDIETRGPALAGWPWAPIGESGPELMTVPRLIYVAPNRGDHFGHVEGGA